MKILILSDLHIGTEEKKGIFGWKRKKFIKLIEELKITYQIDKIILNGDVYEMYHHSFEEIKSYNSKLIQYFNNEEFVYIKGNHDALMDEGLENYQIINSAGKSIWIEHGHNADFMNGTGLGQAICRGFFKSLKVLMNWKPIEKMFHKIVAYNDQIDRVPRRYDRIKYLQYALNLLKKHDMVILSHTHKLEEHKTWYVNQKKTYLNTGSCSLGRMQGILLDTETLKYKTIKINKDKNKIKSLRKPKVVEIMNEKWVENKFASQKFVVELDNIVLRN